MEKNYFKISEAITLVTKKFFELIIVNYVLYLSKLMTKSSINQFLNFLYPFKLSNTFEKFYSSFEMSIG